MNLQAFPFYSSLQQQSRYTVPYYNEAAPLWCPANKLLPFVIQKPSDNQLVDCFNIYTEAGQLAYSIPGDKVSYEYFKAGGYDYIVYYGATLPVTLACGTYYAEVSGWYSELFAVASDPKNLLKITWHHSASIEQLLYQTGFKQTVYLDAELSEPETKIEDEGAEDGYGNFIPTLVKIQRFVKFEAGLLPPFLADALSCLPLHNSVQVGRYDKARTFNIKTTYPVAGYGMLALLAVEFAEDAPVISRLCEGKVELERVDVSSYKPAAWKCNPNDVTPDWQPTGIYECAQDLQPNWQPTGNYECLQDSE